MKKRYLLICGFLVLAMGLGGCQIKSGDASSGAASSTVVTSQSEEKSSVVADVEVPDDYTAPKTMDELMSGVDVASIVELGTYKGLNLTKSIEEVSDAEVEDALKDAMTDTYVAVDKAAEEGDIVNITYTAKVDGEKVEDECAKDVDLKLGSNTKIKGFEEGLIGKKAGDKVKLKLTFPSGYTADLSKKDVTYKVTINQVETVTKEISDTWVQDNTDFTSVDEYKQDIRTKLELEKEAKAETTLESEAWRQVLEGSVVKEYPEALLLYGEYFYEKNINDYCTKNGFALEDYLAQNNLTTEDYEERVDAYGKSIAGQLLVMAAIEKEEGITNADQDYTDKLQALLEQKSMDEKTLLDRYGSFRVEQSIMLERIDELIVENASVTEQIVANTDADASLPSETSETSGTAVSETAESSAAVSSGTADAQTSQTTETSESSEAGTSSGISINREALEPIQ